MTLTTKHGAQQKLMRMEIMLNREDIGVIVVKTVKKCQLIKEFNFLFQQKVFIILTYSKTPFYY